MALKLKRQCVDNVARLARNGPRAPSSALNSVLRKDTFALAEKRMRYEVMVIASLSFIWNYKL